MELWPFCCLPDLFHMDPTCEKPQSHKHQELQDTDFWECCSGGDHAGVEPSGDCKYLFEIIYNISVHMYASI